MTGKFQMSAVREIGLTWAFIFFVFGLLLSIIAVDFAVYGIPVRALIIAASLMIAIFASPLYFLAALAKNRKLLLVIAACAGLGLFVSIVSAAPIMLVIRQLIEIHVQAAIGLILGSMLVAAKGVRLTAYIFFSVWSVTASAALAQTAGFNWAWLLRGALGDLMNDPAITRSFYHDQKRALGLSFTPVHLATQTCLVFAAFFACRTYATAGEALRRLDFPMMAGAILAMLICIASGNRSPLLGFAIFLGLYLVLVAPRMLAMSLPFLLIIMMGSTEILAGLGEDGVRAFSTGDGSAAARPTLALFGLYLFVEQPLGYGLLFESTALADGFVHKARYFGNPDSIRHFTLHNYYLQMLNKYGVLILALFPLLIPRDSRFLWAWFAFIPYIVHIAFHNEGPLSSDFLFWFVIPLFPPAIAAMRTNPTQVNGQRKWTRSYRQMMGRVPVALSNENGG